MEKNIYGKTMRVIISISIYILLTMYMWMIPGLHNKKRFF